MKPLIHLFRLFTRLNSQLSLLEIYLPQVFTGRKKGAHYTVKNFYLTPPFSI